MPQKNLIEPNELRNAIAEIHEEREERHKEKKETAWIGYIAVTTAFLAVFAAVAALQSGSLEDEALISQIKAADTWNRYESDKQKEHLYTVQAYGLVDHGAKPQAGPRSDIGVWSPLPAAQRANQYISNVQSEESDEGQVSAAATHLEDNAEEQLGRQNRFAKAVALISVAIALSALASLTKNKPIWYGSLAAGLVGIVFFVAGFI